MSAREHPGPTGGHRLLDARSRAGLLAWCTALWHARQHRKLLSQFTAGTQDRPLVPRLAATGAVVAMPRGRRRRGHTGGLQ